MTKPKERSPYERMVDFTKKIIQVPKEEVAESKPEVKRRARKAARRAHSR